MLNKYSHVLVNTFMLISTVYTYSTFYVQFSHSCLVKKLSQKPQAPEEKGCLVTWNEMRMASKEYSFSLLDPLSTFSLLEEISSLLCIDRPEFGPLFGEDHRRRVEEDAKKEEKIEKEVERKKGKVEKVNTKEKEVEKGKKKKERGLLTVVAATSSGELVAHACIIASPGHVRVSLLITIVSIDIVIEYSSQLSALVQFMVLGLPRVRDYQDSQDP